MQVLIVENCQHERQRLKQVLQNAGLSTCEAGTGEEAWQHLRSGTVRLAVLDANSLESDGIALCEKVARSPHASGAYLILLAERWNSDTMVQALESGASDCLAKPFKPGELVARVRVGSRLVTLQSQLAQAQKLESIGQLAAGIAHEINTPIQYVGDNLQFVHDSLQDVMQWVDRLESQLRQPATHSASLDPEQVIQQLRQTVDWDYLRSELPVALTQSLQGTGQVARIVSAMKGFSHMGTKDFKQIDLRQVIEDAFEVSRNQWKYVAQAEIDFPDDFPPLFCMPGEINQVFLNLIINAAHAIEETHTRVAADRPGTDPATAKIWSNPTDGKGLIAVRVRATPDQAVIQISDTGGGIPAEIANRIFDPFFTTKPVGKGTGQGLAMAHSIVHQHQGRITFESRPNQGTTFTVHLPWAPSEVVAETLSSTQSRFNSDNLADDRLADCLLD